MKLDYYQQNSSVCKYINKTKYTINTSRNCITKETNAHK